MEQKANGISSRKSAYYLFDAAVLKKRIEYIKKRLPDQARLCYAVKANPFIVKEIGHDVDRFECCSPGEARICVSMAIDPEKKLNTYGIGKYLLRKAFEKDEVIPYSILMREKADFSDAVGHSLRDDLMEYADQQYTYAEYEINKKKYKHATPCTKESLLYREIFEKYYPGQSHIVVDFWMPNKSWEGCNVNDPSARVLSNYGKSGQ